MIPVFLESPYAPTVPKDHPDFSRLLARNLAYARAAVKDCLARNESAYAIALAAHSGRNLRRHGFRRESLGHQRRAGVGSVCREDRCLY